MRHHDRYNGRGLFWIGCLICLSACGLNGVSETDTVGIAPLIQSTHCGMIRSEASVEWIADSGTYLSAYDETRQHVVGDTSKAPQVDLARLGIVAVYMGVRPTSGYAVSLASTTAKVGKHGELTMTVAWTEPSADAIQAQVITSPCLFVSVPKDDYSTIRVVDEADSVRVSSESIELDRR